MADVRRRSVTGWAGTQRHFPAAALGAVALIFVGAISGCSSNGASPHVTHTAAVSPSPVADPLPTVASIQIPTEQDPNALAGSVIDRISSWGMAGATKETYNQWYKSLQDGAGITVGDFSKQVAEKYGAVYAVALFGENYKNNPQLATFVDNMIDYNARLLRAYLVTQDQVPYQDSSKMESLVSSSTDANGTHLAINYLESDNGDQNTVTKTASHYEDIANVTLQQTGSTETITEINLAKR